MLARFIFILSMIIVTVAIVYSLFFEEGKPSNALHIAGNNNVVIVIEEMDIKTMEELISNLNTKEGRGRD